MAFRRKLSRGKVLSFLASQPPCTMAIKACAGAHYWGREIAALGHEVRLVPPITAESSDPAVVAVAVAPGGPVINTPYTLTVLAVAPGVAVVTLTATEAERAVPLSATREFKVTVIAPGAST